MLYHQAGIDYTDDPYSLEALEACERDNRLPEEHFREPVKRMMQALINGREGKHNERIRMPNKQTFRPHFSRIEVKEMLKAKHAAIATKFYSEAGIKLQRFESDIALDIVDSLMRKGITCLPVHDLFIVATEFEFTLLSEMKRLYKIQVGYEPIVK